MEGSHDETPTISSRTAQHVPITQTGLEHAVRQEISGEPVTSNSNVPPSILIVEDSPLHARIMMTMLGDIGIPDYKVGSVPQLRDALILIEKWQPDCILLDLTLPDASGIEAVEAIVAVAPDVPVIVVSSHDDPQIALDAVRAGAQEFMLKWPADSVAFGSLVSLALARRTASDSVATEAS